MALAELKTCSEKTKPGERSRKHRGPSTQTAQPDPLGLLQGVRGFKSSVNKTARSEYGPGETCHLRTNGKLHEKKDRILSCCRNV